MSSELLHKLEDRIDVTIELIELLRLEIEELKERNSALQLENSNLKGRQTSWEQNLSAMLRKMDSIDPIQDAEPAARVDVEVEEEMPA